MTKLTLAIGLSLAVLPPALARADDAPNAQATTDGVETTDAEAEKARTTGRAAAGRRAEIERALLEVREEEASTTRFWPIVTIALGATAVLVGATGGAITAISCDGSCDAAAWHGPIIVGGSLVATGGLLWLTWTEAEIRDVASRRYRLERELDELPPSAPAHEQAGEGPRLALGVRATF